MNVDDVWEFLDNVADECGGWPVAVGLSLLLWWMLIYVVIYR